MNHYKKLFLAAIFLFSSSLYAQQSADLLVPAVVINGNVIPVRIDASDISGLDEAGFITGLQKEGSPKVVNGYFEGVSRPAPISVILKKIQKDFNDTSVKIDEIVIRPAYYTSKGWLGVNYSWEGTKVIRWVLFSQTAIDKNTDETAQIISESVLPLNFAEYREQGFGLNRFTAGRNHYRDYNAPKPSKLEDR